MRWFSRHPKPLPIDPDDPVAFGDLIGKWYVMAVPFAFDVHCLMSEAESSSKGITPRERRAMADELAVMRAVGACLYSRECANARFHDVFKPQISRYLSENVATESTIDEYLGELGQEATVEGFDTVYNMRVLLDRQYPIRGLGFPAFDVMAKSQQFVSNIHITLYEGTAAQRREAYKALTEMTRLGS